MEIRKHVLINKPVEACWKVLGSEYADIGRWATAIRSSRGLGQDFNGAGCSARECVSGKATLTESLRRFDEKAYLLSYDITKGAPPFVSHATNTWQLIPDGSSTRLEMTLRVTTKGVVGAILGVVMKLGMTKMFREMHEEFKYYVERGTIHPRKLKDAQRGQTTRTPVAA